MEEHTARAERTDLLTELVEAMCVSPTAAGTFEGRTPDWWGDRVFGGMVVAQVVHAAGQTVGSEARLHSAHGCFLRAVIPGPPVTLRVEHLRDGRAFTTRQVTTEQAGRPTGRFLCSFHVDEDGDEYQLAMQDVPSPDTLPLAELPGPFTCADAGPLAAADGTLHSSARLWYRTDGTLPDDPAVHRAVLAFFSDMTRTSFRPCSLDTWGTHTDASIDHAVWFHRDARADDWLFYDLQAVITTGARSLVRGSLYDEGGRLLLSMAQELLIRRLPGDGAPLPWLS